MGFGDWIDGAIAPIAPGWAASRMASRARLAAAASAVESVRAYDAAARDRRTQNWKRDATSADAENAKARALLAQAGHDLVRNNKYAAAGVRQLVATIWGDGIAVQITHPDGAIRLRAQAEWDRWAESKVDGFGDWYGHGKVAVREMIVGGEALTLWGPGGSDPENGRVAGIEGAELDMGKTLRLRDGGRIVQGVQFDRGGNRTGYWLFDGHPHDAMVAAAQSRFVPATDIDHLFERLRFRQTRGVSHLGAVAMTLRDIGDIEDAKRLQEKVQACLALVVQPGEGGATSPLGQQARSADDAPGKPLEESLRPGMIARLGAGETATVVNPTPSVSTVEFIRQQIAAVSASLVPYHLMTGDVSQANYSGLRAAMNGSYGLVDDWQQNEIIPLLCRPALERRMRWLSQLTGDRRYQQVGATYALPIRRLVDPIKDLAGEIMEMRAGLKTITKGLSERGINEGAHFAELKRINDLIDGLGLALDTDPRRLTDSGVLQGAAGYLAPRDRAAD